MTERLTDYGALAIKRIREAPTRGGYRDEDTIPVGTQEHTGNRMEFRLVGQKEGHARHAVNTDCTLIRVLFNRGIIGSPDNIGHRRLCAAEQLQEDYEATGNRPQVCSVYSPVRGSGEAEPTEGERQASLRYHAALDSMTQWQRICVQRVCLDDTMINPMDLPYLVAGLDALVQHFVK